MKSHNPSFGNRRLPATVCRIAAAATLCVGALVPVQAGTGTSTQYTLAGAQGIVTGTLTSADGCSTGNLSLVPAATGNRGLTSDTQSPMGFVSLVGFNQCTHEYFFADGSNNSIAFSATGSTTAVPTSITAAGQIPISVNYYDIYFNFISTVADSVTFQVTLDKAGLQFHEKFIDRQTYGGASGVSVQADSDADIAAATVPLLNVSTQLLGNLSITSPSGQVQTDTSHQITIQH